MIEYILEVDNGKLSLPYELVHRLEGSSLVLTGMGEYIEIRTETHNQCSEESFFIEKELLELLMNAETDALDNTCRTPGKSDNSSHATEISESKKEAGLAHNRNHRDKTPLLYLGTYDIELEGNTLILPGKYAELYGKKNSRVALRVYDNRMEIRNI